VDLSRKRSTLSRLFDCPALCSVRRLRETTRALLFHIPNLFEELVYKRRIGNRRKLPAAVQQTSNWTMSVFVSANETPLAVMNTASSTRARPSSQVSHNLANHGNLPDLDDMQELLVYLTLLMIVLSWMMREIHIAFFTTVTRVSHRERSPTPLRVRQPSYPRPS